MKKPNREQLQEDFNNNLTWEKIALKYGYSDSRYLRKLAKQYGLPTKRKILKPDKATLSKMVNEGLNAYEIADKLGYSNLGWRNIYRYLKEYDIKFDFAFNRDIKNKEFNNIQKSIIYGCLLGDGNLLNGTFRVTHSTKQLDYLKWKYELLKDFSTSNISIRENITNLSKRTDLKLATFYLIKHDFTIGINKMLYKDGVKTISKEYLSNIDKLALSVWIMDDGAYHKTNKCYTLCTQGFTYKEQQVIQEWFKETYDLNCSIYEDKSGKGNKFYLWFTKKSSDKLNFIIKKYVPECMAYKV